jgi:hypothetical protein
VQQNAGSVTVDVTGAPIQSFASCDDPGGTSCFMECVFMSQPNTPPGSRQNALHWNSLEYTNLSPTPVANSGSLSTYLRGVLLKIDDAQTAGPDVMVTVEGIPEAFDYGTGAAQRIQYNPQQVAVALTPGGAPDCAAAASPPCDVSFSVNVPGGYLDAQLDNCTGFDISSVPVYTCRFSVVPGFSGVSTLQSQVLAGAAVGADGTVTVSP